LPHITEKLFMSIQEFSQTENVGSIIKARDDEDLKKLITLFIQHKPEQIFIMSSNNKLPTTYLSIVDVLNGLQIDWKTIGWTELLK
jgi:hypothetical protein